MESGRTVLQLTLLPSIASEAAAPATPAEPEPEPATPPQPVEVPRPVEVPTPAEVPPREAPPMTAEDSIDSAEQDSSLIEEKGVISEAAASTTIHPAYPRISRQRGEEGVVALSIQVLASGRAGNVDVIQSSGHRRLDEAACKAARRASFSPARQFGRNIDSTIKLSFSFRLTDD
jgi:protein TonB